MTAHDVNQSQPSDADTAAERAARDGDPAATASNGAGDPARSSAAPDTDDPAVLRTQLEEVSRKADEYLDLLKRARADFTNYRRRMEEEQAQRAKEAGLDLIMKLLPVLDDFERALASARPEDLQSDWAKGVQLIERNLRSLLSAQGVQRVEAEGAAFNPWEHEAISYVPSKEAEEGHVLHVVRAGYKKGDRVIRPAQVVVAGRPQ